MKFEIATYCYCTIQQQVKMQLVAGSHIGIQSPVCYGEAARFVCPRCGHTVSACCNEAKMEESYGV